MSQSPLQHTRFDVAVHQGHQVTTNGISQIKLLVSITDASRQWTGWYVFLEQLIDCAGQDYDDVLIDERGGAQEVVQFAAGPIARTTIQLRRARTVDGFVNRGNEELRTARIHDAAFAPVDLPRGDANLMQLDLALGFDLITGRERESVRANVALLSRVRPRGRIHPALGHLVLLRREPCAPRQHRAGREHKAALAALV